ncbi:hypothetical protein B0H15DRAFT_835956 [Mycena belliarum]|uniref:F-box domain-containing protein n=1 Tax=Mycena belliarum TaxID=1033014 RepID=A0AAD6XS30_9AGAR|nr:hypothetical protein B0H15DRAFT_835956 [Mycena belliae]
MHASEPRSSSRPLVHSLHRAVKVNLNRFETPGHRRKRLKASRSNALAPIASLPPEILAHIFLFCVTNADGDLCWLVVTRVTHHWREIALGCPELWANIVFTRRKLASVMLARSKTVPLIIRVDFACDVYFDARLVRSNIARVGALDMRGSRVALELFLLPYAAAAEIPAGRLTSLSVLNTTGAWENDPMWLDAGLFKQAADSPSRHLRLEQCAFPWNSSWYTNLTCLYLADLHSAQGPTMTQLFHALTCSPLLQDLTLLNTNTQPDGFSNFLPLELAHLRAIHLSEPVDVCADILTNLSFPSITKATIVVSCQTPPEKSGQSIETATSLIVHRDFCDRYQSLSLTTPALHTLRVTVSCWIDKTLVIEISVQPNCAHDLALPVLALLNTHSPGSLEYLTVLHLRLRFFDGEECEQIFSCRNLVTLHLHTGDPLPLLIRLLERAMRCIGVSAFPKRGTDHLAPDGTCLQLFPKLELVRLEEIDCAGPLCTPTDVLRALLWARRMGRCPIPCVDLVSCMNVCQREVDYVRFLAETRIWNCEVLNGKERDDADMRSFSLRVFEQVGIGQWL